MTHARTRPAARRAAALIGGTLAAGLALAGCSGSDDAAAGAEPTSSAASDGTADGTTDGTTDEAADGDAQVGATSTVRYSDENRTVLTLDRVQVEQLTGADLAAGGVADAMAVLAERGTWASGATADHAGVIVEAAGRESDRIDQVLNKLADDRDVELRLFVQHDDRGHVAHFGEDDGTDDEG
ncbi:hypothetical protein ACQFYA_19165 [Promicromonospora sp. Marseille-Q5078]